MISCATTQQVQHSMQFILVHSPSFLSVMQTKLRGQVQWIPAITNTPQKKMGCRELLCEAHTTPLTFQHDELTRRKQQDNRCGWARRLYIEFFWNTEQLEQISRAATAGIFPFCLCGSSSAQVKRVKPPKNHKVNSWDAWLGLPADDMAQRFFYPALKIPDGPLTKGHFLTTTKLHLDYIPQQISKKYIAARKNAYSTLVWMALHNQA